MRKVIKYLQGGDAQAIQKVANAYYGGYRNMFVQHGWSGEGSELMIAAPARVVEAYGSIRTFEELHESDGLMFPMAAIQSSTPNVWLTSFYGFGPEKWGFLGFTDESRRRNFLENSRPGVLVVVYGAGKAAKDELGKVIGVLQCSHQIGTAQQFMDPDEWRKKQSDPDDARRWNFAVKVTRAWRVTAATRIEVREFAPDATRTDAWQHIGSRGERLTRQEALNILKLGLVAVDVYGEQAISDAAPGEASSVLSPSKAGPVSQCPFLVLESEGPKHLYILKLQGDTDAFLGDASNGRIILKAGFSKNPQTRCDDHNRTLPRRCAFRWEVLFSGSLLDYDPYPGSEHAKAGEKAMQRVLGRSPAGSSLGGEFFLAEESLIEEAWAAGNLAAKEYRK